MHNQLWCPVCLRSLAATVKPAASVVVCTEGIIGALVGRAYGKQYHSSQRKRKACGPVGCRGSHLPLAEMRLVSASDPHAVQDALSRSSKSTTSLITSALRKEQGKRESPNWRVASALWVRQARRWARATASASSSFTLDLWSLD